MDRAALTLVRPDQPAAAQTPPRHVVPDTPSLDELTDIACGVARATALWQPHARHDPVDRVAVRLVECAAYEVWLLGWTPGQRVELHDHGGSRGVFVVLDGVLTEVVLGCAGTTTRRHRAGDVGRVPAGRVHDVVDDGVAPATSLHVYAPPLRSMTFYDADGSPTRTELVAHEPVVATPPHLPALLDSSRALHPAGTG